MAYRGHRSLRHTSLSWKRLVFAANATDFTSGFAGADSVDFFFFCHKIRSLGLNIAKPEIIGGRFKPFR